jgi:hypothetical protein
MLSRNLTKLGWLGKTNNNPTLPTWTPSALGSDLALWLDADDASTITLNGSNVSQWNDKSGNARNFTQSTAANQPAYLATGFNNKPTLRTDGNDSLPLGVNGLGRNVSGLTCAIVGLHPAGQTFSTNVSEIFISTGAVFNNARFITTPNPVASNRYGSGGRRLDSDGFAAAPSSTDSLANRGNPWIRIAQRAYSDSVANHWTNGTQDLTNAVIQTAGNTSDTDALAASIFTGVGSMPNGTQLSEIVLTHSTMTNDDRQKLEGYLAYKWGLTDKLPANHPYRWDTSLFGGVNITDTDAQTYIAAVETADVQELELGVKTAINDFIVGAKADGIWDAIKSSAILAGARTLNGALIPLKGTAPTNFNFVAGDYNRKTGLIGNGSTKYLDSNRNNNADPQDNKHISVFATQTHSVSVIADYIGAGGNVTGGSRINTSATELSVNFRLNSSGTSTSNVTTTSVRPVGLYAASRVASANFTAYVAGQSFVRSAVSDTPLNQSIELYRRTAATNYTDARFAFYSIGESLNLALLDTRVSQLITDLGNAIP